MAPPYQTARHLLTRSPVAQAPLEMVLPGVVVGNSEVSAEVSQGASQATDFAVSRSAYIVNHTGGPTTGAVSANARTDTIIYNSPNNYIWGGIDRLLWCGVQTGSASAPAQHVGRYIQTIRQSVGTNSAGSRAAATAALGRVFGISRHDGTTLQHHEFWHNCRDGLVWEWP